MDGSNAGHGHNGIVIRKYEPEDRTAVRKICCDTAFGGRANAVIFDDDELLADSLSIYFTDHEPGSCFIAEQDKKVVGYLFGCVDAVHMQRVFNSRILPELVAKMFKRGTFCKWINIKFLLRSIWSLVLGEFAMPDCSKQYPAILHINMDQDYRGRNTGARLIGSYLQFLRDRKVPGIHLATTSERAKGFFLKAGFKLLFSKQRSYLRPYFGHYVFCYMFGMML